MPRVPAWAPCGANPDLKWRQSPESVQEMTVKQGAILASAARLLKPGGRLVYATCSLLPQENEAIAKAFTEANREFSPLAAAEILSNLKVEAAGSLCSGGESGGDFLRLWPHRHRTDGFFRRRLGEKLTQVDE